MGVMFGLILIFLALSSGSFFGATFLNRKYGEMIPITCFFSITILYIFYIFNILAIGFWLLLFLMMCCYFLGIFYYIKKKEMRKSFLKNFFNPGILVFILFLVIIYFFTKDLKVINFDELRLWSSYPKALYYSETLQFGDSALMLQDMSIYIPGMPLFQFLFTKCMLAFSEGYLYLAYAILGVSIFMPLTKNMEWKKFYQIIVMLFLFLITPFAFANSGFDGICYYKALFIDPILGLIFGYTCYLSVSNTFENKWKTILFLLSLAVLVLLKDTGVILACITYMSFFFTEIFVYKNHNYKIRLKNIKNYIKIIIPLLVIIIVFFSWNITKKSNCEIKSFADSRNIEEIVNGIFNPTDKQTFIRDEMIKNMQEKPIVYNNNLVLREYLTFKNYTILFIVIVLLMFIFEKSKQKVSHILGAGSIIIGLAIYSVAMLVFFIFGTNMVVCFERYFCTYFTGISIYLFLIIMDGIINHKNSYKEFGIILAILSLCIFKLSFPERLQSQDYLNYDEICVDYSNKIGKLINNKKEQKSIIFATSSRISGPPYYTGTLYHHQLLLDLIEQNIKTKWSMIDIDEEKKYEDVVSFVKDGGFDYVFLIIENEEDAKVISDCLKMNITESTLLKLQEIDNEYQLIVVEEQ